MNNTHAHTAGRYVFDLAFDDIISVGVVSHPSLLKVPEDLEVRNSQISAQFLLMTRLPLYDI